MARPACPTDLRVRNRPAGAQPAVSRFRTQRTASHSRITGATDCPIGARTPPLDPSSAGVRSRLTAHVALLSARPSRLTTGRWAVDLLPTMGKVLDRAGTVIDGVEPSQLGNPTPC